MTAVFGTPVAAVLLAVELLLFEWRPRSLRSRWPPPAPAARPAALLADHRLLSAGAALPRAAAPAARRRRPARARWPSGWSAGSLAWLLTACVYGAEDALQAPAHPLDVVAGDRRRRRRGRRAHRPARARRRLRLDPRRAGRQPRRPTRSLLLLASSSSIWSIALGSGTSGGDPRAAADDRRRGGRHGRAVPARRVTRRLGAARHGRRAGRGDALAVHGVVFAFELTHDLNALLPLLIACVSAHARQRRWCCGARSSPRRSPGGASTSCASTAVDPLEALFVRDVMTTNVLTVEPGRPIADLAALLTATTGSAASGCIRCCAMGRWSGSSGGARSQEAVDGRGRATPRSAELMRPDRRLRRRDAADSAADRMSSSRWACCRSSSGPDPTRLWAWWARTRPAAGPRSAARRGAPPRADHPSAPAARPAPRPVRSGGRPTGWGLIGGRWARFRSR